MTNRIEKVASLIQAKLGGIIAREIEFPEDVLVTISKVEVSPDLKHTTVWLAVTPEDKIGAGYGKLRDNKKMLQELLADEVDLRVVTKLSFRVDKSASRVEEIDRILEEIKKEGR